jgi:hypothetical protein
MLSIFKVALDLREGIYTSISFELECIFRTVANTKGESEYSLSFDKWELVSFSFCLMYICESI